MYISEIKKEAIQVGLYINNSEVKIRVGNAARVKHVAADAGRTRPPQTRAISWPHFAGAKHQHVACLFSGFLS